MTDEEDAIRQAEYDMGVLDLIAYCMAAGCHPNQIRLIKLPEEEVKLVRLKIGVYAKYSRLKIDDIWTCYKLCSMINSDHEEGLIKEYGPIIDLASLLDGV